MRPSVTVLLLLAVIFTAVLSSEAKLQQQATVTEDDEDDDDDDDDDWDDDEDDGDEAYGKSEVDDDGRIYKNPRNSPSAMCPRDEEQAGLLGQKCLRKCSTDEDCKSKKKKCRCDGACGMSCIKPDRECPELSEIPHGQLTVTGRLFGDRAHYVCDPNLFTVGLAERSCRADGDWTGSTPSCKRDQSSFCSDPPKIKNARHNAPVEQTTFDLDTEVQYFCDHGYQPVGIPKAKCLMMHKNASWFGPDITCEPRSCGAPTDVPNGWPAGECYTYNCRVAYHCIDGYELVGKKEKICLADGTWSPTELPQCVQVTSVQCPQPENPRNGKALFISTAYNAIVQYECNYGYTVVGQVTRTCNADRRWSGPEPICKEIDCGSPGILYNGWIENIDSGTKLGASLIYRCNEHMKLQGNSSAVCQSDGKWRYPLPDCLAPCVMPQIEKGHLTVASLERDHINNVTVVEDGSQLLVACIKNYEFAANSTPVVCKNGTWSIIPSCSPARCKQMPKSPKNGMVIAPKTDHGMRAVFKCKDGFSLVGGGPNNSSRHVECRYGNWIGDIPHCVEVYCSFPGYLENGKVLLVGNMGVYDYRPYVKKVPNNKQIMYDCDKGYVLSEGPPGATCIGGNWSPRELPACLPGQHPRLRWSRRRRSVDAADPDQQDRAGNSTTGYRKFIDFFRRIGKKLLHLELNKAQNRSKSQIRTKADPANGLPTNSSDESVGSEIERIYNAIDAKIDDPGSPGSKTANNSVDALFTRKKHTGHRNKSRSKDDKMIDFLRVVYRKLRRIDSRRSNSSGNASMHDLLNLMSKNFFHVDLAETRKGNATRGHDGFEVRNQREFTRLKREFERIMKFYNKSLRWSAKQNRKESKRRKLGDPHGEKKPTKDKKTRNKKRNKNKSYYKGFYEFINGYVNEKLSILETQNGTDELIRKMNIDKFTVRNGTTFTVGEIYAFFKHIIENKLNVADEVVEGATTTGSTVDTKLADEQQQQQQQTASDNQTTSSATAASTMTFTRSSAESGLGNEIPTSESNSSSISISGISSSSIGITGDGNKQQQQQQQPQQQEVKKHRTKRIRNAVEETTATYQNRKLLSVRSPLSNAARPRSTVAQTYQALSPEALAKSKQFTLNGLEAQQQSRTKRFLPPSELDNQIILKNLYLNAYEDEYRANVRRSISLNSRANWTALRRRKGNLDHYEIK